MNYQQYLMVCKEREPYNVPREKWDVLMIITGASRIMDITVTFFSILNVLLQLPFWLRIQMLKCFHLSCAQAGLSFNEVLELCNLYKGIFFY